MTMSEINQTQSNQQPVTEKRNKRLIAGIAVTALAATLAGGFGANRAVSDRDDASIAISETAPTPEKQLSSQEQVADKLQNLKVGDTLPVAPASYTLEIGSTMSDPSGAITKITEPIIGILNPVWAAGESGGSATLCFVLDKASQIRCFDPLQGEGLVSAFVDGPAPDFINQATNVIELNQDNAATANVTIVQGDGFASGVINGKELALASHFAAEPEIVQQ